MAGEIYVDPGAGGAPVIMVDGVCYQLAGPSDQPPSSMPPIQGSFGSCDECAASSSSSSASASPTMCNCSDYVGLPSCVMITLPSMCGCTLDSPTIIIPDVSSGGCYYQQGFTTICEDGITDLYLVDLFIVSNDGPCYWDLHISYVDGRAVCDFRKYDGGPTGSYQYYAPNSNCTDCPDSISVD
jgi:hypothetical protein